MNIISTIASESRIKILVLVLSFSSFAAAIFSLDYITHRLLQREAYSVGMHWAEDIETRLGNLDEVFSHKTEKTHSFEILRQLSSVGNIYRYELIDAEGNAVFDTSTHQPANTKFSTYASATNHKSYSSHTDHHHGKSAQGSTGNSHENHPHIVTLETGDGISNPKLYAHVIHPIVKDGTQLGTLKLYIDQTDAQALISSIVSAFVAILSCMFVFAVGLPTFLYVRSKTKEKSAQHEFTQQQNHLDAALSIMHQGFCMYDNDGKVILSNDRYATIYKLQPDQIRPGKSIQQIVESRIENGCYIGGDANEYRSVVKKLVADHDNHPRTYQLTDGRYVEICDFRMTENRWFTVHEDITERVVANNELKHRNERLDAALKTMLQGLCMFGADERIIVSNDQYAEIYGISPDQIQPGTKLLDILELRIKNGTYAGANPDSYREERLDWLKNQQERNQIHHLKDGRYIEIRDHPMPNGGWLSIHEDVTERHESEKKIKYLADFDALTSLPNRSQIHAQLENTIRQTLEEGTKMALLCIDLDGFKDVNDTLGHPVGDRVLKEVGARLTKTLSKSTIAGRLSGDEFIVIVKEFEDETELKKMGDTICSSLAAPIHVGHHVIDISASIGISTGPPADGEVETFIQFSDLALYQAKADGGNSYRFFEEKLFSQAKEQQRMAADLRTAISNNELLLHYQPQVDLASGRINGYEALIRWQHSELGMISPLQFISLAEETGQINEIGEWVLRTACNYAVSWPNREKVSVNLSPVQFKRQDIVGMVQKVLKETGLAPERLELEITESVLIQNADSVIATLQTLSDMGISIALDDFGTGFSSMSYLTTFPFNKIKIDKSFIDDLGKDSRVTAIVSMIISLGRSLDAVITAEGIEEPGQHVLLRAAGCNQVQGYFYGRPLPQILDIDQPESLKRA
ncbi:MAG: EAL domain-containing protein [Rhizobiaceae bacterium]|nr:EAL domain-containing protein [Rhizobiaceae bacterium]